MHDKELEEVVGSNLACGLVFLCFFTYIMFKLHFNETMTLKL